MPDKLNLALAVLLAAFSLPKKCADENPSASLARSLSVRRGGCQCGRLPRAIRRTITEGVKAVWDLGKAYHETTPTRERICINGLWRWQPAGKGTEAVPAENWGYFKVPGCWPGIGHFMQKDCQIVYAHPAWKDQKLREVTAAWYQREIVVPKEWAGRRITLHAECVNSYVFIYVDGKRTGEIRFPWGERGSHLRLPPGREAGPFAARRGHAAEGKHAGVQRH